MSYKISEEVRELEDYIVNTRRYLHQNPELSLKEYNTKKFIVGELDKLHLEYEEVGETGILVTLEGKNPGPTIFLRADIDALPLNDKIEKEYRSKNKGVSHGCGHDAHTTGLLALAKILSTKKELIKGKVKLCFQPAEEIGAGARQFVKAGHLDDVDYAFGIHTASDLPVGVVGAKIGEANASCDIFKIHVKGESAHGSRPDLGRDAVLAGASIVVELQNLVSRRVSPLESVVLTIGKLNAGTAYNIIGNDAYIEGTLRTLNSDLREHLIKRIETIAKNVAEVHECEIEFQNYNAASVLKNDKEFTEVIWEVAGSVVGDENVIKISKPSLGAEDFADYLELTKGTFLRVGTSSGNETSYPHHHEKFDIDEEGILIAVEIFKTLIEKYSLKENKEYELVNIKKHSLVGIW